MAVTAKFEADFTQFSAAVDQAVVKFRGFEAGAASVEGKLNRLVDNFSGRKIISEATLMAQAVERIGGTAHLTEAELQRMGAVGAEAAAKLRAFGQEVPKGIQDLASHAKTATGNFDLMKSTVTSLAGAFGIVFSIGAVVNFARQVLASADALTKLRDKTGIGVEALQLFQVAGDDAGNTIEEITSAVNKFQDKLINGDASAAGALHQLGLSFDDLRGKSPEAQFMAISDRLRDVQDPARQVSIAIDLFGKQGATILPTLKRGFDDIRKSAVSMSADTVEAIDDVGDALGRAGRRAQGETATAFAYLFLGWGKADRDAVRLTKSLHDITLRAGEAAPKIKSLAPPGLPEDLDEIERALTRTATASIKAAKGTKEHKDETEKLLAVLPSVTPQFISMSSAMQRIVDQKLVVVIPDMTRHLEDMEAVLRPLNERLIDFGQVVLPNVTSRMKENGDEIEDLRKKYGKLYGYLDDVDRILTAIPGKFAEVAAVAARTGKAIIKNLAEGDIVGAVVSGIVGAIEVITKLFRDTEKQINPVREQFVQLHGGLAALNKQAVAAGVSLTAMLNAKTPEAYKKAIDDLNAALDFQDKAMATLNETAEKYGFTIQELGPQFAAQKLHEQAGQLLQDYQVLTTAGVDHEAIIKRMGPALQEYVSTSMSAGIAIPASMRPVLQSMVDMGQLLDANGQAMTDLEGLTFAETLDEKFSSLIDTINKLADAISRGLGTAINNIPDANVAINAHWNIPDVPMQEFATGGVVLPFRPRGSDTVPAMLSPGEMVLTKSQQAQLLSGGGGGQGNAELVREMRELRRALPKMVRDAVLLAS